MDKFIEYCMNGDIMNIKNMSLEGCVLDDGFILAC